MKHSRCTQLQLLLLPMPDHCNLRRRCLSPGSSDSPFVKQGEDVTITQPHLHWLDSTPSPPTLTASKWKIGEAGEPVDKFIDF
jgi:hypothetical protein